MAIKNLFVSNKTVYLITGAETGTSFPIAIQLIQEGYKIHLVSGRKKVVERLLTPHFRFTDFSSSDLVNLATIGQRKNIQAVLFGNSESYLVFASELAKAMSLVSISEESAFLSYDKEALTKKLLGFDARVSVSPNTLDKPELIEKNSKPFFLKPVDGCGNDEVRLFNDFWAAYSFWLKHEHHNRRYIIEQSFFGDQYDVEGISCNGNHHIIGITKEYYTHSLDRKTMTQAFNFSPSMTKSLQNIIENYTRKFLNKVNVTNGAWHLELIVEKNQDIYWLDFGNRVGGTFEFILEEANGKKFLSNFIYSLVGSPLDLSVCQKKHILRLYALNIKQHNYLLDICRNYKSRGISKYKLNFESAMYFSSCDLTFDHPEDLSKIENFFMETLVKANSKEFKLN